MPSRSDEEKQMINAIRDKLNEVEAATRACIWMSPYQKDKIFTGMSWTRDHINRGKVVPSMTQLYDGLFFKTGMNRINIEAAILELEANMPTYTQYNDQLWKFIVDFVGGSWADYEGQYDKHKPDNYKLSDEHPDKTDQFGFPYYLPTDRDGVPIPDFDRDLLSCTQGAQGARQRIGVVAPTRDQGTGHVYDRYPLPKLSENNISLHMKELQKFKVQEAQALAEDHYMLKVKRWYKEDFMPSQLKSFREGLENQQQQRKEAYKAGHILKEDIDIDIDTQVDMKRDAMQQLLDIGESALTRYTGAYDQWQEQQRINVPPKEIVRD